MISSDFGYETDVELDDLTRKFMAEGIPEDTPREKPSSDKLHAHLPDSRVLPIQERLWLERPILAKYNAMFATSVIEPPWTGQLPDGRVGTTQHRVCQFIISSEHPRPLQRRLGLSHVSIASAWKHAWDNAERERKHYVTGGEMDPAERIFRALAAKHVSDLLSLESMI
jgi:hypothetical protein